MLDAAGGGGQVYVVGEVKAPGAQDFRPDLTPREYVALAGGPNNRAKMSETIVTFRNGRTYAMAERLRSRRARS